MKQVAMFALAFFGASPLIAQQPRVMVEFRPFAGIAIPTGEQRHFFKEGPLFGVQGAVEVQPYFHLLGTAGWVPVQGKYGVGQEEVNILHYSVGIELGPVAPLQHEWQFMPFIGFGAGARTYLYSAPGLSDKTCGAGYAAVGAEFKVGGMGLRLEGRDNLFCYRSPLAGVGSRTRNELAFSLGLAYHLW